MSLPDGLYDLLITEALKRDLPSDGVSTSEVREGAVGLLMDAVARQLAGILEDIAGEGEAKSEQQLALVNSVLVSVRERLRGAQTTREGEVTVDLLSTPLRRLTAIKRDLRFPLAPEIGFSIPWLFTAGKGSPALLHEIRRELASADTVDILVSFITVSGVRKLRDVFDQITAVDALGSARTKIRILTTTYMGATEAKALDELGRLPGCEVKVSLDGRRTRLHAKAWLFGRRTGFGTAYVGSANLTGAALTGGLEWTVKLTQRGQESLFRHARANFESLWADNEFQTYDPSDLEHRQLLSAALQREAGGAVGQGPLFTSFFDLQPKSYQLAMLEQLANERSHGRNRNLVVAATGTGKTVVAAFDYRRVRDSIGSAPRLLFVAHREEILRQALRTYREVLRNPEFGEILAGGETPNQHSHLFATIDSVTSRRLVQQFGPSYWHTVVVDECHRLAGARFDTFVKSVKPAILLGLTATPERTDGTPITPYFDARPDGSPAVEMRLWHALDLQLLAPFEYYACDDPTDFRDVPWDSPSERDAIDSRVKANAQRAALVVNEWRRLANTPNKSRALVFCVSVEHARFMAEFLTNAGLPAACVVGETPDDERRRAPERLADPKDELCALVTVDLYNEGVDLPFVDTLLLLRPTQSPVLFQQQIGRGLRLASGKDSCLVLDFVGQHKADFRFDRLFSSLTGLSRQELLVSVNEGFASLPPGCYLHLQPQTRKQVLHGIQALVGQSWRRLTLELQSYAALRGRANITLADFLREQRLELEDVYRTATGSARSGWTTLKREAGLLVDEGGPDEAYFSRRLASLLHLDDPERIETLAAIGGKGASGPDLQTLMLAFQVDTGRTRATTAAGFRMKLEQHPFVRAELAELSAVLEARRALIPRKIPGLEELPLYLHASYGIREILTAVGFLNAVQQPAFNSGVLVLKARRIELLFVTLDKEEGFHAGIAYHDYAISADQFHWQTQNSAGPNTMVGKRYLESASNGWQFHLFVRARKSLPYRACGPVTALEVTGNRPMNIVWRLQEALPAQLFREFSVLR